MQSKLFSDMPLHASILRAVNEEGYASPTPIQEQTIPSLLEGRDLIGCAPTGTGKTAAFALPILQRLTQVPQKKRPGHPRVLVLTPTRELAAQVGENFRTYGRHLNLTHALVFGGVNQRPQVDAVRRGVDILVATPGRLLDLIQQGHIRLSAIETVVLDEADRMLDMGFLPDMKKVMGMVPQKRQTLLFSATLSNEIVDLSRNFLTDPVKVSVAPSATMAANIDDRVCFVKADDKRELLNDILISPEMRRALVFTRTKHGADRLVKQLTKGTIQAVAIHGNKSQNARMAALEHFRKGRCRVLVATDIAARGIDVDGITHVVNFDMPMEPEVYVHRIGRTARAGASGVAYSLCSSDEKVYLGQIERLLKRTIPVHADHAYHCEHTARSSHTSGGGRVVGARNAHNPNRAKSGRYGRKPSRNYRHAS